MSDPFFAFAMGFAASFVANIAYDKYRAMQKAKAELIAAATKPKMGWVPEE